MRILFFLFCSCPKSLLYQSNSLLYLSILPLPFLYVANILLLSPLHSTLSLDQYVRA